MSSSQFIPSGGNDFMDIIITKESSQNNGLIMPKVCGNCKQLSINEVEELIDKSSTGKKRPWKKHKNSTELLCESFKRIGKENKANLVRECGTQLGFIECQEGHYKGLKQANFCRIRLCPMCGWRRSFKVAYQVKQVAHRVMETGNYRWVFLTLTTKSVMGDKLSEEIDHYVKSFQRLSSWKQFKKSIAGFFRTLEVTYNKETDTYHPHYHVLLAVRPSYFTHNYISKKEWAKMWQKAAQIDYEPIVDVRAVKSGRRVKAENNILAEKGYTIDAGVVAEMSKYTVKSGDYLFKGDNDSTDKVVSTLENALRGRRLFAFGGLLKEIYKQLEEEKKIEDVESEKTDLTHVSDELQVCNCPTCNSTLLEVMYRWFPHRRGYYRVD
jgi:plasmid rolling circle replication initiator protein Rep